ncbi:MAG: 4Fe-4S binding protein [Desulfitobacterium hafniense]|uniref:4Fe-4S binding protein n=1 Tax=Desulfitobacterium hafniense TaxID=49338 RepID=UPI002B1FA556|nr:4Fe-4S binding protein [Desulfitobacterium hafniense]MEA5024177.1 4Fe-4S binding protein [Desulfitobacterium hafniense]
MKKLLGILLILSLVLAWGYGFFFKPQVNLSEVIRESFPELTLEEVIASEPLIYEIRTGDAADKALGYAAIGEGQGYAGPVKVLVNVDTEGQIISTRVVEHKEWQNWFDKLNMEGFFDQFVEKKITDPLDLDQDIDGITGATYSSRGVATAISKASHELAKLKYNYVYDEENKLDIKMDLAEWVALLFWIGVIFANIFKKYKYRKVFLFLGIPIIGYWLKTPITLSHFAGLSLGYLPDIQYNLLWYIMMGGIFGTVLTLGKNVYCYWVCPFGGLQELLALAGSGKLLDSRRFESIAKTIKIGLVWFGLMIAFISRIPSAGSYEPFGMAFTFQGVGVQVILLVVVLLVALMNFRFWCRYACPVNLIIESLAKLRNLARNLVKRFSGTLKIKGVTR